MEQRLHSISQTAFIFFWFFGLLHLSSTFLVAQELQHPYLNLAFNTLDLPFLLAGLVYLSLRLSLNFGHIFSNIKIPLILCSAFSFVVFLIALYLNFFVPDASLF